MKKHPLLTTRILNEQGKIGPFFFKEFLFVFLGTCTLFFLVLLLSLFVQFSGILLLLIPGSFLGLLGSIRLLLRQQVQCPWYVHDWLAQRFFQPRHIVPDVLGAQKRSMARLPTKQLRPNKVKDQVV